MENLGKKVQEGNVGRGINEAWEGSRAAEIALRGPLRW